MGSRPSPQPPQPQPGWGGASGEAGAARGAASSWPPRSAAVQPVGAARSLSAHLLSQPRGPRSPGADLAVEAAPHLRPRHQPRPPRRRRGYPGSPRRPIRARRGRRRTRTRAGRHGAGHGKTGIHPGGWGTWTRRRGGSWARAGIRSCRWRHRPTRGTSESGPPSSAASAAAAGQSPWACSATPASRRTSAWAGAWSARVS